MYVKKIRISNSHIQKKIKLADIDDAILTYLRLRSNCDDIYTGSLFLLLNDLGYSCKCRSAETSMFSKVLNLFEKLYNDNVIEIVNVNGNVMPKFSTHELFCLHVFEDTIPTKYTPIDSDELNKLIHIAKYNNIPYHKLFNVYMQLKSRMSFEPHGLHYCYPSTSRLKKTLGCCTETYNKIINVLVNGGMIFKYEFDGEDLYDIHDTPVDIVYSIEEYDINLIKREFEEYEETSAD